MAETILQYLTWAFPSGCIGAAIAWLANRGMRKTREAKEVHDTYKSMYEMVSQELLSLQKQVLELHGIIDELNKEKIKTNRVLNRLTRAIEAIQLCSYSSNCPVRAELQAGEELDRDGRQGANGAVQQRKKGSSAQKAGVSAPIRGQPGNPAG